MTSAELLKLKRKWIASVLVPWYRENHKWAVFDMSDAQLINDSMADLTQFLREFQRMPFSPEEYDQWLNS